MLSKTITMHIRFKEASPHLAFPRLPWPLDTPCKSITLPETAFMSFKVGRRSQWGFFFLTFWSHLLLLLCQAPHSLPHPNPCFLCVCMLDHAHFWIVFHSPSNHSICKQNKPCFQDDRPHWKTSASGDGSHFDYVQDQNQRNLGGAYSVTYRDKLMTALWETEASSGHHHGAFAFHEERPGIAWMFLYKCH